MPPHRRCQRQSPWLTQANCGPWQLWGPSACSVSNVPTTKEAVGTEVAGGAWRAIMAPKGTPNDVRDRLVGAVEKIVATDEFKRFMNDRGFGISWAKDVEFDAFLAENEKSLGETLKAVGLAK